MLYCRDCGHQVHETAPSCPQCGAAQHKNESPLIASPTNHTDGFSIASLSMGIFGFIVAVQLTHLSSKDEITGSIILNIVPIILGVIGLSKKETTNKTAGAIGTTLASLGLLMCIGQL